MTDERRERVIATLRKDTDEKLLERFAHYIKTFNPIDYDRCDDYEMVKAEVLRRMRGEA